MRQFIARVCANAERKSLISIEGKLHVMRQPIDAMGFLGFLESINYLVYRKLTVGKSYF